MGHGRRPGPRPAGRGRCGAGGRRRALRATKALAAQRVALRAGVRRPPGRMPHRRGSRRPRHRLAVRRVDSSTTSSASPSSPLRSGPPSSPPRSFGRFRNPTLGHSCAQVGADGSRKLPQRFRPSSPPESAAGLDTTRFATVTAIWVAAAAGLEVDGSKLPPGRRTRGSTTPGGQGPGSRPPGAHRPRATRSTSASSPPWRARSNGWSTRAWDCSGANRDGDGRGRRERARRATGAGVHTGATRTRSSSRADPCASSSPTATRNCPLRSILASVEPPPCPTACARAPSWSRSAPTRRCRRRRSTPWWDRPAFRS